MLRTSRSGLVALDQRHADHEHRHADVRERPCRSDARVWPAALRRSAMARRSDDPRREREAEADQRAPVADGEAAAASAERTRLTRERPAQPHRELGQAGALPARERADAHEEQRRRHERHEHGLEVRRPDRDLARAERVERERIERAEEHRARGAASSTLFAEQQRFARHGSKAPPSADARGAPGIERQRAADEQQRTGPG